MAIKMSSAAQARALYWLLPTAATVVLLSLLVSGPMAFGMVMATDDAIDTHNPLLYALGVLLVAAVTSLAAAVIIRAVSRGRRDGLCVWLTASALATGGLIVATFALEMLSVGLGR